MTDIRTSVAGALSLVALIAAVACDGGVICGAGTVVRDGVCVLSPPSPSCAEGTTFDPDTLECRGDASCGAGTTRDPRTGACVSDSRCGPGTYLDEQGGACLSEVTCGPGTFFDPDLRACAPLLRCGDGTVFDEATQSCVPSVECGEGTVFQPLSGSCVSILQCGVGLVAHEGVCLTPADVMLLDPDERESNPDANDPALGGSPEPFTTAGGTVVLAGNISRMVDDAGAAVQDRDFWRFFGMVGQVLRVRVLSNGLPNPGFRITGPEGYLRTAPLGVTEQPERMLVLTKTGFFDLEVSTRAALLDDDAPPMGASDFGYVVVVELAPLPAPIELLAGSPPAGTTASGAALDLEGNVFKVRAAGPRPIELRVEADRGGTVPVALLFDAAGTLVSERELSTSGARVAASFAAYSAGGFITLVIDWESSNGLDVPFDVRATGVAEVDLGTLSAGGLVEAPRVDLAFGEAAAYVVNVTAGDVVEVDPFGAQSVEIAALLPNGRLVTAYDSGTVEVLPFVPAASGPLRVLFLSKSTTARQVQLAARAQRPLETAVLSSPLAAPVTFSGPDLFPRRQLSEHAFVLVPHTTMMVVEADLSARFGIPRLLLHRLDGDGVVFATRVRSTVDWERLAVLREGSGQVLFEVDLEDSATNDPDPPVLDWRLVVDARDDAMPTEDEPNDGPGQLLPIGGRVRGSLVPTGSADDIDAYTLSIDPPLGADEVLELQVTGINNSTSSLTMRGYLAGTERFKTTSATMTGWMILPGDGAGPWTIALSSASNSDHSYFFETRRATPGAELEPNDSAPQALGAGATSLVARVSGADVDQFSAVLQAPVSLVRARNLVDATDLTLTVRGSDGAVLAGPTEHEDAQLSVTRPVDGVAIIEVRSDGATADDLYRLSVEPFALAEEEPNDDVASAHTVALADYAAVFGNERKRSASLTSDYLRFSPQAPLGSSEAWAVRWFNLIDDTDLVVRVSEETAPGVLSLVADGDVSAGELAVGFGGDLIVEVSVDGLTARADSYLIEVERVAAVAEREPNDTRFDATPLPVGGVARGQSRANAPDLFVVATSPGLRLSLTTRTLLTMKPLSLRVLDAEGNVLTGAEGLDPAVAVVAPGDAIFVEVAGGSTATGTFDAYALAVSLAP